MAVSQQQRFDRANKRRVWIVAIIALVGVVAGLPASRPARSATMIKAGKSFAIPPESVTSAKVAVRPMAVRARDAWPRWWPSARVTVASEVPGMVRRDRLRFRRLPPQGRGDGPARHLRRGGPARRRPGGRRAGACQPAPRAGAAGGEGELARRPRRRRGAREADRGERGARSQAIIAKKTIRAPFDGRVGIRQVELGQVLAAGTPIASLQSVDPIYAEFWLPQQALADLTRRAAVRLTLDVFPGHLGGPVTTINPEVDVGHPQRARARDRPEPRRPAARPACSSTSTCCRRTKRTCW